MAEVRLSWLNGASYGTDADLISEAPVLEGSISAILANRILYTVFYLRNVGSVSAYNCGWLVTPHGSPINPDYSFHSPLQWGALDDGAKPYGAFTVFGFSDALCTDSYIDRFIADTLTAEELRLFQHTWTQGTSTVNSIPFDTAYRYKASGGVQSRTFETYVGEAVNANDEQSGLVKVLFGVRLPDSIEAQRVLLNHSIYYEEAL